MGSEVWSSQTRSSGVLVEQSGKAGDRAVVVPGCVAHVLHVGRAWGSLCWACRKGFGGTGPCACWTGCTSRQS